MRISTNEYFRLATQSLVQQQAALSQQQFRLSSGKAILGPSDDPIGSAQLVDINNALEAITQFTRNGERAQTRLGVTEEALKSVTENLQRVRELTVAGANGTQTNETRLAISKEIRQRLDDLVNIANSRDANGEYIFAGNQTGVQPFEFRNDVPGGVTYNGDDGQRLISIDASRQVLINESGREIFMNAPEGNGVFATTRATAAAAGMASYNTGGAVVSDFSVTDEALYSGERYRLLFLDSDTDGVTDQFAVQRRSDSDGDGIAGWVTDGVPQAYTSGATISAIPGVEFVVTGTPTPSTVPGAVSGNARVVNERVTSAGEFVPGQYAVTFSDPAAPGDPFTFTVSLNGVDVPSLTDIEYIPGDAGQVVDLGGYTFTLTGEPPVNGDVLQLATGDALLIESPIRGSAAISPGEVTDPGLFAPDSYTIIFDASDPDNVTFDVVDSTGALVDDALGNPISGIAYEPGPEGMTIGLIPGIAFDISGTPADGDRFTIEPAGRQSIFETYANLVDMLGTAVSNPTEQAALQERIERALQNLDQSVGNVIEARADAGGRLRVVEDQISLNADRELQFEGARSRIEDLDYAEAITQLQLQITAFQAAQQSFVRIQNLSLFDIIG